MKKDRLLSLDVFRGATIAAMILVNTPGSWTYIYSPFKHAEWHGCTPTDLIFPFFIFMVGVAVSISRPKTGIERSKMLFKILKRSFYLFGIGLLLNGFPFYQLDTLRVMGVLQRIALVFLVIAILHQYLSFRVQMMIGAGLLIFYWVMMSFVPVPSVGAANLEPTTNFGAWFDGLFLSGHMWSHSKVWDPEGLFSTLPAIITGLLGMATGKLIFGNKNKSEAIIHLFVLANTLIAIGLLWDLDFPINKSLWTSSYVLYTGGVAINVFALLYWVLDIQKLGHRWVFPFQVFGSNAIVAFTLSIILIVSMWKIKINDMSVTSHVYQSISSIIHNDYNSSLTFAVLFVMTCYIPVWVMYKRNIFVKI